MRELPITCIMVSNTVLLLSILFLKKDPSSPLTYHLVHHLLSLLPSTLTSSRDVVIEMNGY